MLKQWHHGELSDTVEIFPISHLSQHKEDAELLKWVPRRVMKIIKRLEHLCYGGRMKELDLFILEKRRLQEAPIAVFQYSKGAYKQEDFLHGLTVVGQGVITLN